MISRLPYKRIFLSGIGGTGMAALANLLVERGVHVAGSDNGFYPPMDDFLKKLPIELYDGYSESNIINSHPELVIIGNALSRNNPEVEHILNNKIPFASMAGAIKQLFLGNKKNIVVTGTHGKTTTTSLLAHVFNSIGPNASFLVGGIPSNFNQPSLFTNSEYFIIEGDEYDSSFFEKYPKFHHYLPHILIINNLEFDHADIYSSLEDIKKQFRYLVRLVPRNGIIIANGDDKYVREILNPVYSPVLYYGQNNNVDFQFHFTREKNKFFLIIKKQGNLMLKTTIEFPLEGWGYNITATLIASIISGIDTKYFADCLEKFKGVKRRLELIYENENYTIYDDFAHHPTAVSLTLKAIKKKYNRRPVIAIFEPRSNTSSANIFVEEYKHSFNGADYIFLAPPYKKTYIQNKQLDVKSIQNFIKHSEKKFVEISTNYDELLELVKSNIPDQGIIVIMSNGSFEPFKSNLIQLIGGK